MIKIKLSQGKFALVDDEDFEYLNQWKWYFNNGYAVRSQHISFINGKQTKTAILMHRVITKPSIKMGVDHINRNRLDNRKANLRVCSQAKNRLNSIRKSNNTSGYIGVCWDKTRSKWLASIHVKGRQKYLGRYNTALEAARSRDRAAKIYYGEFGTYNNV